MSGTLSMGAPVAADQASSSLPRLPARWEPWMERVLDDQRLFDWVSQHGSPINLIHPEPMGRHVAELNAVAARHGLDFRVFFARKTNKCLSLVDAALAAGAGVDTASENELIQAIGRGASGGDLICTAAVKDESLVGQCIRHGVVMAIDNDDELARIDAVTKSVGAPADVAVRLGGFEFEGKKLPTRFGYDVDRDVDLIDRLGDKHVRVVGLHFHLDGYCSDQRVAAIRGALRWHRTLLAAGHAPTFLDIGGGLPMSYLESRSDYEAFWDAHEQSLLGHRTPVTHRNHSLGRTVAGGQVTGSPNCYPYFQSPTRGAWFDEVLRHTAEAIGDAGVQLRCEPGRSLIDGCGMTVARVVHRKRDANGDWLIGLAMNRTQCRTGSDDFLVDPRLVAARGADRSPPGEGYLTGAYCTESEVITTRRLAFESGVAVGDLVALPNTAGYLMHFLESRSHQFPLAKNLVVGGSGVTLDPIDEDIF